MERIRDMLGRLRAALTPQAVLVLLAALALILLGGGFGRRESTDLEARIARTLSQMEGAGRVQVVIATRSRETSGSGLLASGAQQAGETPCGAVAVAEGAGDPLVRMELEQALCALLGLPASAVSVVAGADGT